MEIGKVKWFNDIKGYGFIETSEGKDIFVHRSGLLNAGSGLEAGQEVEFETKSGEKGLVAVNVKAVK